MNRQISIQKNNSVAIEALRKLIAEKGTQYQAAQALGVANSRITEWLRGKNSINPKFYEQLGLEVRPK